MEEILHMSALELGKSIREGKISVSEAAESCLEQIRRKEPDISAFLFVDEDGLKQRVKEVEEGIRQGRYTSPLAGVPVAVKDNICTRGMKTTCASRMLENFVPQYDAEAVKRLEEAGMIIVGKTNMDEFAMGSTSETSYFQTTKNPWNTKHVPGGSSGGSCAAVSAGEVWMALGSDTGGSIRQPASYCGVTGLKPTYGRVSRYGLIAYASSLDQIGPIGRNVKDCAAFYDVIAGKDEKDASSSPVPVETAVWKEKEDLTGVRIGIPREYLGEGTDPQVKQAIEKAAALMEEHGAFVEWFSLKMTEYVIPAYYIIACAEASSNLERFDGVKYGYRSADVQELHEMYKKSRQEGFGEEVKRRILLGSFVLSSGYYDAYYLKALKTKALIKHELDMAFQKYDCILAPASPSAAPELGTSLKDPLKMYLSDIDTVAVNLAGLPAICLPCGMDSQGLPIGMQLIGDCFQEKIADPSPAHA